MNIVAQTNEKMAVNWQKESIK